ncbi:MAG TPA: hypothetical protein VE078_00440 [Thermoanaerobaculia bacterium]|nr:hypothetical protein [Thermoanaerobaculia bacterium]
MPAHHILSALVVDGQLMLGTSGHGVLVHELSEDLFAAPAQPPAAVVAAGTDR